MHRHKLDSDISIPIARSPRGVRLDGGKDSVRDTSDEGPCQDVREGVEVVTVASPVKDCPRRVQREMAAR
jgi:hypothetical protein